MLLLSLFCSQLFFTACLLLASPRLSSAHSQCSLLAAVAESFLKLKSHPAMMAFKSTVALALMGVSTVAAQFTQVTWSTVSFIYHGEVTPNAAFASMSPGILTPLGANQSACFNPLHYFHAVCSRLTHILPNPTLRSWNREAILTPHSVRRWLPHPPAPHRSPF